MVVASDGKTQVTIEYLQKADGAVEPKKIHTVVISTQHAEPLKAVRSKECAGYSGPEMTAPSMEEMNKLIVEHVVKETLKQITLKNGETALTLFGWDANFQSTGSASILFRHSLEESAV